MGLRSYVNLPSGATHKAVTGLVFYRKYSLGWLVWDTYHKSWRHTDHIVLVEEL
jgi:hypothetical protein